MVKQLRDNLAVSSDVICNADGLQELHVGPVGADVSVVNNRKLNGRERMGPDGVPSGRVRGLSGVGEPCIGEDPVFEQIAPLGDLAWIAYILVHVHVSTGRVDSRANPLLAHENVQRVCCLEEELVGRIYENLIDGENPLRRGVGVGETFRQHPQPPLRILREVIPHFLKALLAVDEDLYPCGRSRFLVREGGETGTQVASPVPNALDGLERNRIAYPLRALLPEYAEDSASVLDHRREFFHLAKTRWLDSQPSSHRWLHVNRSQEFPITHQSREQATYPGRSGQKFDLSPCREYQVLETIFYLLFIEQRSILLLLISYGQPRCGTDPHGVGAERTELEYVTREPDPLTRRYDIEARSKWQTFSQDFPERRVDLGSRNLQFQPLVAIWTFIQDDPIKLEQSGVDRAPGATFRAL